MNNCTEHLRFHYDTPEEFKKEISDLGLEIPFSEDLSQLGTPVSIGERSLPNRLCVLPMEGRDSTPEGAPSDLTFRRYERFARGGAGLLWTEADSVNWEGRASEAQLYLNSRTLDAFSELCTVITNAAGSAYPENPRFQPYKVLQLTHSGRYACPEAVTATVNPVLDPYLPPQHRIITDEQLEELIPAYVNAAVLARRAGFDAVDIKTCHCYLLGELLSAENRPGKYGGSYENRTRLLLDIVDRVTDKVSGLDVCLRINATDMVPGGFGVGENLIPDMEEPLRLVGQLHDRGVRLLAVSVGNPYYNPHIGRPYDSGFYTPYSHPLKDTERIFAVTSVLQKAFPDMAVVCTGMSWLREMAPYVAAGLIRDGFCSVAGFGRQAFAYPDFARDILLNGGMQRSKCCVTCSNCTALMRAARPAGCPIRDREGYGESLKEMLAENGRTDGSRLADHV